MNTFEYTPGSRISPLTVIDLTVDGGAVARHEGRVVFLDRGLPEEVVAAEVVAVKKKIVQARTLETLRESPHAVAPWCPHAAECGGCSWQHFAMPAALAWKERHVRETLARIGKLPEIRIAPILASPKERRFRNKMAYAFAQDAQGGALLGLRKRGSRDIIEVTDCGIQDASAMDIVAHVRRRVRELDLPAWPDSGRERADVVTGTPASSGYLRFLVVHTPELLLDGKPQILVECITGPEDTGARAGNFAAKVMSLGRELMEGCGVTGFVHSERRGAADLAQGEAVRASLGKTDCLEGYGHITISAPHSAFLQTNTGAARLLYAKAAEAAGLTGKETLWDVYCGAGGIALYMAAMAAEVHGFDIQKEAVAAARANAAALGCMHCRFHEGRLPHTLSLALQKGRRPPDVIIVDPPRAGMEEALPPLLAASGARTCIYISCDVATQARDLARMRGDWRLEEAFPVDMFPCTPHVENIAVLRRTQ